MTEIWPKTSGTSVNCHPVLKMILILPSMHEVVLGFEEGHTYLSLRSTPPNFLLENPEAGVTKFTIIKSSKVVKNFIIIHRYLIFYFYLSRTHKTFIS